MAEDLNSPDGGIFTRLPGIGGVTLPCDSGGHPVHHRHLQHRIQRGFRLPAVRQQHLRRPQRRGRLHRLHPYLLTGWPAYFNPASSPAPCRKPRRADVNTDYFLIPTQDLPLLNDLRDAPGAPSAYADLIQPDMRVLVDLGYNWTGDADVGTPAPI